MFLGLRFINPSNASALRSLKRDFLVPMYFRSPISEPYVLMARFLNPNFLASPRT